MLMYGQCYQLSRHQNAAAASRDYAERFPERQWSTSVINLIQRRNRQDQTQNFRKQ
jgi:hypothetical protein